MSSLTIKSLNRRLSAMFFFLPAHVNSIERG
jgi:hypothetical protein